MGPCFRELRRFGFFFFGLGKQNGTAERERGRKADSYQLFVLYEELTNFPLLEMELWHTQSWKNRRPTWGCP